MVLLLKLLVPMTSLSQRDPIPSHPPGILIAILNGPCLNVYLGLIDERRKRDLFFALPSNLLSHSYQCYLAAQCMQE